MPSDVSSASSVTGTNLKIVSVISSTFISYLCIGMALTVLPAYVHGQLGFDAVIVGVTISLQFVATLLSRPFVGPVTDRVGAKQVVITGLGGCLLSGLLVLLSVIMQGMPIFSLAILLLSRAVLGLSQGMIGTGSLSWGIGIVGSDLTSKVISWNGIAGYGALAIGAPLGAALMETSGLWSIGPTMAVAAAIGVILSWRREASPVIAGKRMPFYQVFARISPFGLGLGLSSVGFGVIATFITLYYASQHWPNAAWCLTLFGAAYICARLFFAGTIDRFGGYQVAIVCLLVESLGLALLWLASTPLIALLGAGLAGFGLSLVYPALGVEAVAKISSSSRSAALGAYSLFLDLAIGVTGPLAGWIAGRFDYSAIYLCAALAALFGGILTIRLFLHARQ
ncbi:MFS transporter [Phytohalomonas tamaricis]|uniref:MFS transporter n=1 Tax=Phytohalomonas tamaricis TaxID=2081032 RepID=UPI000D0AF5B2|nr:MFS transporter [Phytohalomonas tamaricis]